MKNLLQRLLKITAYFLAAVVIVLAIAVGLFRLMLPRLPEYQEQIKTWASAAIGMQVEFSDMNARWRLSGPELSFRNAELSRHAADPPLFSVDEVSVGVSLVRLMIDRELVADRILISEAEVTAVMGDDGSWIIQGVPVSELLRGRGASSQPAGDISVIARDILVHYHHPGVEETLTFGVDSLEVRRDEQLIAVDANIDPPPGFGDGLKVAVSQRQTPEAGSSWQFFIEGNSLNAAAWSVLQPDEFPAIESGIVDLSLWFQRSRAGVHSATANFLLSSFSVSGSGEGFGASGRLEFTRVSDGWLVAASNFSLDTAAGDAWPKSGWQIQAAQTGAGELQSMSIGSSYVRLQDLRVFAPWLSSDWRAWLLRVDPTGVLREFAYSRSGMDSETPVFELSARLDAAGFAPVERWPGLRGFSGSLRADTAGGRLEIDSENLFISLPAELPEPVQLDDAMGTVIWRRNADGTLILSDSIHLRNTDINSQTSLQISVPADAGSPIIDLRSDWSINDIGSVNRYLPMQAVKPALYRWLTGALISGQIPRATTRIVGPLDRFPFDGGEGEFRIDARVENAVLRYSDQWPAATNMDLDIAVDRTRLYSHQNSSMNLGNSVKDAQIEIADLRTPVLEIDAFATGTLKSIRDFSQKSPIADIFGGQLDRISVGGDASFNLNLVYPLADSENFDFETRIRSSNGSIRVQGFPAPITELNGLVIVSRADIRSELLFGRFLGEPVDIELVKAGEDQPEYTVVAIVKGQASAAAIIGELGAPLDGVLEGAAPFTAQLFFPARQEAQSAPFRIVIDSELQGLGVRLPPPISKSAQASEALSLTIDVPERNRIEAGGSYRELTWSLVFESRDNVWDFDRGVLTTGGMYPGPAETRGLHIEGLLDELHLEDWLALARNESGRRGFGQRIRSIDLTVNKLDAIGQQLTAQRVVVNRSAQDWIVQLDGEHAVGTISVPYDFSGERPLSLEMQKLVLPGKDEDYGIDDLTTDPRNLPQITLAAEEFAFGDRHLGRVRATFDKTANGIESRNVEARDETFSISGTAGWVIDETDVSSQRSYVAAKLKSSDVSKTMQRLNYEPGIVGQDLEIDFDLYWSGAPRQDYMQKLNGNVAVRLGAGQLNDVEPGPGRVFGLMSVVALPRRLSLDFRDVLDKGFGFDEITGRFRVADGDAYTCDLSLKGPAADVGIVGRAGLASREYSQSAVVSTNVGNTLPVVGAVVAGPQVAAALLIFSQIFKKPLQEMGQFYYAIEGSWDQPTVENANAQHFAATSTQAGCVQIAE